MADIAVFEEERRQAVEQLDLIQAQIKDDAGNAELLRLRDELNEMISLLDESIAELKPAAAAAPSNPPRQQPSPPPQQEKWSREKHPAFRKAAAEEAAARDEPGGGGGPVVYKVNDTVMAKWASGDKSFYPARITSITGSSTAPVYIVKFKSYDTVETLRAKDIRPMSSKRRADGSAVAGAPPGTNPSAPAAPDPAPSGVISAAASMYPEHQQQQQQQQKDKDKEDGDEAKPPKPKKIKAKKELEAGKSRWQDFNSKSKFGKAHKKDSMFRTPEGIHGRVGFTGSGQAMRKDQARSRHVYQVNDDVD